VSASVKREAVPLYSIYARAHTKRNIPRLRCALFFTAAAAAFVRSYVLVHPKGDTGVIIEGDNNDHG